MFQKRVYELSELEWKSQRESLTEGVLGKVLIPEELTDVKVVLTKVEPGGVFSVHKDLYHHVFYFIHIQGEGECWLEEEAYQIQVPPTSSNVPISSGTAVVAGDAAHHPTRSYLTSERNCGALSRVPSLGADFLSSRRS